MSIMTDFFKYGKRAAILLAGALLLTGCADAKSADAEDVIDIVKTTYAGEVAIVLSDTGITVDGEEAPDEEGNAVYIAHDIIYYEDRDTYESGNPYGEGAEADRHSAEEADQHTVVHITEAGTYRISGTISQGQIAVDLGEDAKTDPEAVVTLVLDDADITCTVAPAVIFYNVYECDTAWTAYDEGKADSYEAGGIQDTSAAGARVILADYSENQIHGSYVAKVYKDNEDAKKKYKFDGAFYSKMSMNIDGEEEGNGVLNIVAENEGLDTELHLTINGGKINIQSQDDGINTNEDGVSVTTINGGALHIVGGLGTEGDGIDSNGYLMINGGIVIATANPNGDSGLDSDMGSYINGGYVVATGSAMDWAESDSDQVTMNLQFASMQDADEAMIVTDADGKVIFAYDPDQDETTGSNNRGYQGVILSCPEFTVGATYHIYIGGDVEGTETDGLYDAETVTGFDGAALQSYTGTDVGIGGRGGFPGGKDGFPGGKDGFPGDKGQTGEDFEAPENGVLPDFPEKMEIPEFAEPLEGAETPEGGERPERDGSGRPDGDIQDGKKDMQDGFGGPDGEKEIRDGFGGPDGEKDMQDGLGGPDSEKEIRDGFGGPDGEKDMQDGFGGPDGEKEIRDGFGGPEAGIGMPAGTEASTDFYMNDKVNAFSGVADAAV